MAKRQLGGRPVGGSVLTVLAAALAVATTGCGTPGEMGNGTFYYECSGAGDSDPACTGWSNRGDIPDRIAVEASFRVTFEPHQSQIDTGIDEHSIVVEPASWQRAAGTNGTFRLLDSGTHSLIARSDEGTTIDYVHVEGRDVAGVGLLCDVSADLDPLVLPVGQTAWLVAAAEDQDGWELAGSMDFGWRSQDSAVASVQAGASVRQRGIYGEAAGTTTVEVTVGGTTREVRVEVQP